MGNGSGGFNAPLVYSLGSDRSAGSVAIGDLNNDGKADVLVANNNELSALLGSGSGTLAAPVVSGSGTSLKSVSLGDFDGDGKLDVLSGWSNTLQLQKGQGNGTFTPWQNIAVPHPIDSAVVGDVNSDGKLDIAVAGSTFTCTNPGYYGCYDGQYRGQTNVILGNGSGNFALPIASSLGTISNASFVDLALADLTGDGRPDIVTIEKITSRAIVAVNDGDWFAPVALSISDATVVEGHSGSVNAVFNITLATPSSRPVTVQYSTADLDADEASWFGSTATSGIDYTSSVGILTIPAGQTNATISISVRGDRIGELDEDFFVNLSSPNHAILSNTRGLGTIRDDEPYVSFEYYSGPEVVEGNSGTKPMTFIVELSGPSDIPVTVGFATADVSALAGSDYQAKAGTVTFAPGVVTQTFVVQVIGDALSELDETFMVNLVNPINAKIGTGHKFGYIIDNDAAPSFSISDAWVYEGNSGSKLMTFTITLSQSLNTSVRVSYSTANGTAKSSNNDYVSKSGTITFKPGETTKTITISIKGDKKAEGDEWFYVNLSNAVGASIEHRQGIGRIFNDD